MAQSQPILNAPVAVRWIIGVTVIVFLVDWVGVQAGMFPPGGLLARFKLFLFIPTRYTWPSEIIAEPLSVIVSPFGHAFLHAGWGHLIMNMAFLLAFGSAVARRMGTWQFIMLYATGAVAGAFCYFALDPYSVTPMIGASGAVSATVGALTRISLTPGPDTLPPPPPFHHKRTAIAFIAVFVAINVATAILPHLISSDSAIAWEAHLGGALAGYLLMPFFDRPFRA